MHFLGGVSRIACCLLLIVVAWPLDDPALGAPEPVVRGPVTGRVLELDPEGGTIALETEAGREELSASPPELHGLERGDDYEGEVEMIGERPWLVEQPEATAAVDRTALDRTRGRVAALDAPDGTLLLADPSGERTAFRAHPRLLSSLAPGREIEIHHHEVGATRWVHMVDPAPRPELARRPDARP